jgi:hypothetical protein
LLSHGGQPRAFVAHRGGLAVLLDFADVPTTMSGGGSGVSGVGGMSSMSTSSMSSSAMSTLGGASSGRMSAKPKDALVPMRDALVALLPTPHVLVSWAWDVKQKFVIILDVSV